jgi:Na+/proline symporter
VAPLVRVIVVFTVGASLFVLFAWLRARVPFSMERHLVVTIPASLAPWVVPGILTGLFVPRRAVLAGVILGLATGVALALWQDRNVDYFEIGDIAIKGGWGILFCGASAWIGTRLHFGSSSSNNRFERSR